jgi:glucose-6-phosphate 1-dehydrogenase
VRGRDIPADVKEDGVTPGHGTQTFAEVLLEFASWRWSGTRFHLRSGKPLGQEGKEIVVRFRQTPHVPSDDDHEPAANTLRFGFDPECLTLGLTGTGPGVEPSLVPLKEYTAGSAGPPRRGA